MDYNSNVVAYIALGLIITPMRALTLKNYSRIALNLTMTTRIVLVLFIRDPSVAKAATAKL